MLSFKKVLANAIHEENELWLKLQQATQNYSHAIKTYEQFIDDIDKDAGSELAQRYFADINVAREEYLELRKEYETHYGSLERFERSLERLEEWRKEVNAKCLIQRPLHLFTTK